MSDMPLEAKLVITAIVVLLVGAIVAYHVWMNRREGASATAASPVSLREGTSAPSPASTPPASSDARRPHVSAARPT